MDKEAKKKYDRERYLRLRKPKGPRPLRSKYRFVNDGADSSLTAHKALVERILGKPLPVGAEIHHVDGDGHNNDPRNLVVCPDHAYHALLHRRQEALGACGNADWLRCVFCGNWDAPQNLHLYLPKDQKSQRANHTKCSTEYSRRRREVLHGCTV